MYTSLSYEAQTYRRKVFARFRKEGIIGRCIYLQHELGGHDILDKKTKVKFGTSTHRLEGLLDFIHISIWGPAKTASLGGHKYFVYFMIIYLGMVEYIP